MVSYTDTTLPKLGKILEIIISLATMQKYDI